MRQILLVLATVSAVVLVAGCIVSDELTTITIQPDGSADMVKFCSNIRSTEKGSKAEEELRRYIEAFDGRNDQDYVRITQAGGEVLEARWVRHEEPYANVVTARFPNSTTLENFNTIKGEKGEVIAQAHFTQNGTRRKLSLVIPVPKDEKLTEQPKPTVKQLRQEQANGISETRLIVAGGQIIASQGFSVASDKRSALLDPTEIDELLRSNSEQVELFLEWELNDK